jgi:hypothetical protein
MRGSKIKESMQKYRETSKPRQRTVTKKLLNDKRKKNLYEIDIIMIRPGQLRTT